ncbi:MAG: hypothetical protein IPK74_04775 [Deltaproteobacteria bacterium]|nr:hypothetical protein [Deltaproteobacteria bacterium]
MVRPRRGHGRAQRRSAAPRLHGHLAAWLALSAACKGDDDRNSCGVPTNEISIVATLVDNGLSLRTEVDFAVGDRSTDVDGISLCSDDELSIAGEQPNQTERNERVIYSHTQPADGQRSVEVVLTRTDGERTAVAIELPEAFDITAPAPMAKVSRSADFMLTWAPPAPEGSMRITLVEEIGNGICLETGTAEHDYKDSMGVDVDDDGNWLIPAAVIAGGARDKCDAQYRFARYEDVAYPSSFAPGGYIEGRTERIVAFVSVP